MKHQIYFRASLLFGIPLLICWMSYIAYLLDNNNHMFEIAKNYSILYIGGLFPIFIIISLLEWLEEKAIKKELQKK